MGIISKCTSKIVYLIIDGMTETDEVNSTLLLSKTPVINGLINKESIIGFYDPVIGLGDKEPKTDVVIPHFFGLPAEYNPGRTALELVDNGVQIEPLMLCVEIKVRFRTQENEDNWVKLKKIPNELIHKLEIELAVLLEGSCGFVISKATESGARILFYSYSLDSLNTTIDTVGNICQKYELVAVEGARNQIGRNFPLLYNRNKNILFIGWAKGSLRGALKLCGLDVNEFSRKRGDFYNWSNYYKNFNEWGIPKLRSNLQYEKYVLYTKESSFAARRGNKLKKREAIEFMDAMLGRFLAVFPEEIFTIVIFSDHSSEIGGISNPAKNTCFAILEGSYRTIDKRPIVNFSESFITRLRSKSYSQEEVMTLIDK
jgi:2,3-bisphosphoglycerate-independent phosphoglycerate mutase